MSQSYPHSVEGHHNVYPLIQGYSKASQVRYGDFVFRHRLQMELTWGGIINNW